MAPAPGPDPGPDPGSGRGAPDRVLARWGGGERARARLVGFPFAGGSAASLRPLRAHLPADVELLVAAYPGRGPRLAERCAGTLEALVAPLAARLAALPPRPTAFVGASFGCLVAFETARALRARGAAEPALLVALARRAPDRPLEHPPLHALPREAFHAALAELGGTPPEVLAHAELMALVEPALRADLAIDETHVHRPEPPLAAALAAWGGTRDATVSPEALDAWAAHGTGGFERRELDGGHFLLDDAPAALGAALAARLAELA